MVTTPRVKLQDQETIQDHVDRLMVVALMRPRIMISDAAYIVMHLQEYLMPNIWSAPEVLK